MIGKMHHRIIVETPVAADDGQGGRTISWVEFAVIWAQVTPMTRYTREENQAERTIMATRHEITIRDLPGLDATMRIQFRGRYLQIKSVSRFDEERRFYMRVMTDDGMGS